MADLVRYFGTATGTVQGVGFRMFVQQNASELGITGWVKNMDDGTVTMEVQGTQEAVDRLEEVIRQGNYFIKVQSFGLEVRDVIAMERRFDIRY
ncbi:acylphosphatase [Selenomonas ruminantium]|uniref:acylphosphatase n=1 Tax=Selenomonas ruminantium TaxID=971 RepID=A0A1M6U831_SELRU|nr:acylphosphatase [Selenomonas ruminantium]SHK65321.1 acylphosphatase [Selenomonas ruminantium]